MLFAHDEAKIMLSCEVNFFSFLNCFFIFVPLKLWGEGVALDDKANIQFFSVCMCYVFMCVLSLIVNKRSWLALPSQEL